MEKLSKKEEDILLKSIGERILKLRRSEGYNSQEAFAYVSDIPRAQYGRYEKGINMTIFSLYRILRKHNMTFEEFFAKDFEELNKLMKAKK